MHIHRIARSCWTGIQRSLRKQILVDWSWFRTERRYIWEMLRQANVQFHLLRAIQLLHLSMVKKIANISILRYQHLHDTWKTPNPENSLIPKASNSQQQFHQICCFFQSGKDLRDNRLNRSVKRIWLHFGRTHPKEKSLHFLK